jgi:hypothetical protein
MLIRYTHRPAGPKSSQGSADITYWQQRSALLEKNIAEITEQIDAYEKGITEHPLLTRIAQLRAVMRNEAEKTEQAVASLAEKTDSDKERDAQLVQIKQAAQGREALMAENERTYQEATRVYLAARQALTGELAAWDKQAAALEAENRREADERALQIKQLKKCNGDRLDAVAQEIREAQKQHNAEMHKPAKKMRELGRKRDKLVRRLEAICADMERFSSEQPMANPADGPETTSPSQAVCE